MGTPSPEEMKAGVAGVFDRAAATYDQVGVEFFEPIGRFLVSRTDPRPGERVLDVGCGRGASAIPAAEAVGPTGSVLATDLAPSMVEETGRAAGALPWLAVEVGDAEQPHDGTFDIVQAGPVLFFLPSLDAALARYRDLLAGDGRLYDYPDRWQGLTAETLLQRLAEYVEAAEERGETFDWQRDVTDLPIAWRASESGGCPARSWRPGRHLRGVPAACRGLLRRPRHRGDRTSDHRQSPTDAPPTSALPSPSSAPATSSSARTAPGRTERWSASTAPCRSNGPTGRSS